MNKKLANLQLAKTTWAFCNIFTWWVWFYVWTSTCYNPLYLKKRINLGDHS